MMCLILTVLMWAWQPVLPGDTVAVVDQADVLEQGLANGAITSNMIHGLIFVAYQVKAAF